MIVRISIILAALSSVAVAEPLSIRCDDPPQDLHIDGLLDEWSKAIAARAGSAPDSALTLRCAWDGTSLHLALDVVDDRIVRVKSGRAHEDHVDIAVSAGAATVTASIFPGNALAAPRAVTSPRVKVADSLQPKGFSIEATLPAKSRASLGLRVVFHDADQATGGDDTDIAIDATIELGAQKDLFDDFLRATRLRRTDLTLDAMAKLDPDRAGQQRVVAGGAIIGVITDQFAYAQLPVARPADVLAVELLPLGPRGQRVIAARFRQGASEVLGLWTVWSGQLQPLAQIELKRTDGDRVVEDVYQVEKGRLLVTPKRVHGWTADTWPDDTTDGLDPIVTPWEKRGGVAYALTGAELVRRPLPKRR